MTFSSVDHGMVSDSRRSLSAIKPAVECASRLPSLLQSPPHCTADRHTAEQHLQDGVDEVGIGHQRETANQLNPAFLFLAVHEQHEADAARHEREDHQRRIKSSKVQVPRSKLQGSYLEFGSW